MRDAVADARFPLPLPTAADAGRTSNSVVKQLQDYLIPRVERIDAPLLVVVGGSTGAGKSTLVNSVVRAKVSVAGVLRPTTRAPVLVSHPDDIAWFAGQKILPGLTRSTATGSDRTGLTVIASDALPAGLALLDAPDIDSVVEDNRALADRLLAAADLWLFVTSAARYADAVPWTVLRSARDRGTVLALVLDRIPPGAQEEIAAHLHEMLAEQELPDVPLFVVAETTLDRDGLLPAAGIGDLRGWLARLAGDAAARSVVIRTTLIGALRQIVVQVQALAAATDEQVGALSRLRGAVTVAYDGALDAIDDGIRDGTLLRGEVLARWQEFVGTGDLMRALQARFGRMRDAIGAAITGRPRPGRAFEHALTAGLSALIQSQIATAAEAVTTAWRADPAGAALLTEDLVRSPEDVAASTDRTIRDWQRGVLDLVREQGADKRRLARVAAYTVNATGLLVMIAVFASTAFIPTGAEIGVAAGTTLAAQKLLEAMFGEDALRQLAGVAREDLLARVRVLLDADAARFMDAGAAADVDTDQPQRLRTAAHAVADLTSADPSLRSTPRTPLAAPTTDPGAR